MIINHNMMAINANRMANVNSSNASKAMAKISSGLRINTAADDAAGLAISEKMKGQVNGLNQASSNAQDGISLVQTAEGALNETTSVLQRLRTLAVQASNDTNTTTDRAAIQTEASQLIAQIDNIGNTTQFNTKNLLDGGAGVEITATTNAVQNLEGTADTGAKSIALVGTDITLATAGSIKGGVKTQADASKALAANSTIGINGKTYSFTTSNTIQDALDAINADSASNGVTVTWDTTNGYTFTSTGTGSASGVNITEAGTGDFTPADFAKGDTKGADAKIVATGGSLTNLGGAIQADGNHITVVSGAEKGLSFDLTSASNVTINVNANNSLKLQIGANEAQTMSVSINDMRSEALGVSGLDLTTQPSAEKAITDITKATERVSTERAKLGAYQNRLESTINNLGTSAQNLTSAQSQIADVDMASEMAEFSKDNVLSQAAQAMLAQANQQPSQILQLLRG